MSDITSPPHAPSPSPDSSDFDPQEADLKSPMTERELHDLVEAGESEAIEQWVDDASGGETARIVCRLAEDDREKLLSITSPEIAAEVVERLPESIAVDALEHIDPACAADIMHELPTADVVDFVNELGDAEARAILAELDPEEADVLRTLASYESDVAGGLMTTEYLKFRSDATVEDVVRELHDNSELYQRYDVQYAYVCDAESRLVGVLRLRDLLLTERDVAVSEIMIPDPEALSDRALLRELDAFFDEHHFFAVPVQDDHGRLVGVVHRRAVEEALAEQSEQTYRKAQGIIGGEELRTMPLFLRSRRRLVWLSLNVLLNIAAASVIAVNQDTLEAVIALAVFLPIISDMSGCSGNQAVAVSMRELSLGVTEPRDVWRVLGKELAVGLINGVMLGVLLGLAAWAWKGNPWLGGVVGVALALNTLVAVAIGGCVPLLLKGLKLDPALASGPILTTMTDMCGFFLVLTMAAQMLSYLT